MKVKNIPSTDCHENRKHIDLVLCIDQGAEMPILNGVKDTLKNFYGKYAEMCDDNGTSYAQIRVKLILFSDLAYSPIRETDFFSLPEQTEELERFVDTIVRVPGGDEPQNALEAIALALKSDWVTGDVKKRHIIAVFTEASAHPLGKRACYPSYPDEMPKDLDELIRLIDGTDGATVGSYYPKRANLICFCPDEYPWNDQSLNQCVRYCPLLIHRGHGGLADEMCFDILIESLSAFG